VSDEALAALRVRLSGRLVDLEPLGREHERDLAEAARESDWSWMPLDAGASGAAFSRWLSTELERAETGQSVAFATIWRESGRAVGTTHLHEIRPEHRRLEIGGTWLARALWQSGANVEAKLLLLEHAFALGYQRVELKTHPDNWRSRKALEALPAQFEGVLRKHLVVRDGEPRDSAYYSVIDDEWPAVRENLERRLA
jgi:RimJ/RimL family protein N-acetyltransferase